MAGCSLLGFKPSIEAKVPSRVEFRVGNNVTSTASELVGGTYKFISKPKEVSDASGNKKLVVPLQSVSFWEAIDWALAAFGVMGIALMVAAIFVAILGKKLVLAISLATGGALTLGGVVALKMFLGWIVGGVVALVIAAGAFEAWKHRKTIHDLVDDGKINNSNETQPTPAKPE